MKTRKMRTDARSTYTYKFSDGTSLELKPGSNGVTEATIALLHRMDDNEVYNNGKQMKAPVQDWEKDGIAKWKNNHPNEDLPPRYNASLDYFSDTDDMDSDQSYLLAECAVEMEDSVPDDVEKLREIVSQMPDELVVIYHRVLIEKESETAVAEDLHINRKTVYNRVQRIKKLIRENF